MLKFPDSLIGYLSPLLMIILVLTIPAWLNTRIIELLRRNGYLSKISFRADLKVLMALAVGVSCLVLGLAALGFLRLETSLGILLLFPSTYKGILKILTEKKRKALRAEFTYSLSLLQGLLELGTPFPQALYTLSQFQSAQLSELLHQVAERFKKGQSIQNTSKRLEKKAVSSEIAKSVEILEIAYCRGASLSPIIQVLQPILENEVNGQEKLDSLKQGLWTQAIFSFCMPWGLLLITSVFQPELLQTFSNHGSFKGLILGIFIWEGFGFWAIQKQLSF